VELSHLVYAREVYGWWDDGVVRKGEIRVEMASVMVRLSKTTGGGKMIAQHGWTTARSGLYRRDGNHDMIEQR
jgi:hypothetical protein